MQGSTEQSNDTWGIISAVAAILSFIVSLVAMLIAKRAAQDSRRSADASERSASASERSVSVAEKSVSTNIEMFKREGVIDLHLAWRDVSGVDPDPAKIIPEDVRRAVNALDLTASLWNHDVIAKDVLYRSYWPPYKSIYDILNGISYVIEDLNSTGKALLSDDIKLAYEQMEARERQERGEGRQTTITGKGDTR